MRIASSTGPRRRKRGPWMRNWRPDTRPPPANEACAPLVFGGFDGDLRGTQVYRAQHEGWRVVAHAEDRRTIVVLPMPALTAREGIRRRRAARFGMTRVA